ncbi:hypothetical protein [Glaciibacter psychrotolerans]|uniref:Uncharacterized protein n=1 Tax=Glaciibacter psychrotolerans TaxID=670054 RepID=A0A7Z0EGR3_9MICO|nr:hypothetical protein [Leifsonia psychrotolerans]NYJ20950.1 hypothetical protein [Leifsonia psychrotolerans]
MTATDYAQSVEKTPGEFSWRKLERHAYDSYPQIPPLLDALGTDLDGRKKTPRLIGIVGGLVMLPFLCLYYIGPMITAGILLVGSQVHAAPNVILAWAGAIAVWQIIFRIKEWVHAAHGGEPAALVESLLTYINTFFAATTAWAAYMFVDTYHPVGVWLYFILFLLMTFACLTSTIMMARRGRAHDRGELIFTLSAESAVNAAIGRLPEEERDAIKNDLATALETLATAGVISTNDQTDALRQPPGDLASWRWYREPRSRQPK